MRPVESKQRCPVHRLALYFFHDQERIQRRQDRSPRRSRSERSKPPPAGEALPSGGVDPDDPLLHCRARRRLHVPGLSLPHDPDPPRSP